MPRTPEQNQEIKDKRRSKILAAAIRVFATKEYDDVAIDDIVKVVGCSHGLFYHYFQTKEQIYRAVFEEVIIPNQAVPPVKQARDKGGYEGLKILAEYMAMVVSAGTKLFNLAMIWLRMAKAEKLDKKTAEIAKAHNIELAIKDLVHEGQIDGQVIAGDPEEIADLIYGIFEKKMLKRKEEGKSKRYFSADVLCAMLLKQPL